MDQQVWSEAPVFEEILRFENASGIYVEIGAINFLLEERGIN